MVHASASLSNLAACPECVARPQESQPKEAKLAQLWHRQDGAFNKLVYAAAHAAYDAGGHLLRLLGQCTERQPMRVRLGRERPPHGATVARADDSTRRFPRET